MSRLVPVPMAVFLLFAPAAPAGEAAKPIDKPGLAQPTVDDMDKPGKPGVPPPRLLPDDPPPEKPKAGDTPRKKAFNPFRARGRRPKYAVPARITWSDGKVLEGWVWRRANGHIRIFNRKERAHQDYFLSDLTRIDVKAETENFERDWRWKNQGSSEKVFLDIGYFWNQYVTTLTTTDGEAIAGDCSGQFYAMGLDGKKSKWYLYKRLSGRDAEKKKREELKPLVHVLRVEFTDDFLKKLEEEKKAEAEAAKKAVDKATAAEKK